jgi:hypothetical protein
MFLKRMSHLHHAIAALSQELLPQPPFRHAYIKAEHQVMTMFAAFLPCDFFERSDLLLHCLSQEVSEQPDECIDDIGLIALASRFEIYLLWPKVQGEPRLDRIYRDHPKDLNVESLELMPVIHHVEMYCV